MITFRYDNGRKTVEIQLNTADMKASSARAEIADAFDSFLLAIGEEPYDIEMTRDDFEDRLQEAQDAGYRAGKAAGFEEAANLRQQVLAHQAEFEEMERVAATHTPFEGHMYHPQIDPDVECVVRGSIQYLDPFPTSATAIPAHEQFTADMEAKSMLRSECGMSPEDQRALNEFLYGASLKGPRR